LPHIFEVLSSIPIEKNKLTVRVQTWSFSWHIPTHFNLDICSVLSVSFYLLLVSSV
jgi:hypothetical protein